MVVDCRRIPALTAASPLVLTYRETHGAATPSISWPAHPGAPFPSAEPHARVIGRRRSDDRQEACSVQGLRQDGHTADWLRDGQQAELALATTPYDILLLDLGLPGRSGLDVLARLRRSANSIPVLVITARDAIADRIRGLDAGADDYLVKPFDSTNCPHACGRYSGGMPGVPNR